MRQSFLWSAVALLAGSPIGAPADFGGTWILGETGYEITFTVNGDTISGVYTNISDPSTFKGVVYYVSGRAYNVFQFVQANGSSYKATFAGRMQTADTLVCREYDVDGLEKDFVMVKKQLTSGKKRAVSAATPPKVSFNTRPDGSFRFPGFENAEEINVHSGKGELLVTLHGTNVWDGRDENGAPVAGGLYVTSIVMPEGTLTAKIAKR